MCPIMKLSNELRKRIDARHEHMLLLMANHNSGKISEAEINESLASLFLRNDHYCRLLRRLDQGEDAMLLTLEMHEI